MNGRNYLNKMEQRIYKGNGIVKKIGDSYYLRLDKQARNTLNIDNGTILKTKLMNVETDIIVCPNCKFEFIDYIDNDVHDCPNCDKEFTHFDSHSPMSNESDQSCEIAEETQEEMKGGKI